MKNSITGIKLTTFIRIVLLIISIILIIIVKNYFKKQQEKSKQEIENLTKELDSLKILINSEHMFSKDNLKKYLNILDFKYPEIIYKVAIIETGNFTSRKFKVYNNLWGLQYADDKPLKFETWKHCVRWQRQREYNDGCDTMNKEQYILWLKRKKYNGILNIINNSKIK